MGVQGPGPFHQRALKTLLFMDASLQVTSTRHLGTSMPSRGVYPITTHLALWGTRVSPSTMSDLNKKIYGTVEAHL
jgi:hypothetical protein